MKLERQRWLNGTDRVIAWMVFAVTLLVYVSLRQVNPHHDASIFTFRFNRPEFPQGHPYHLFFPWLMWAVFGVGRLLNMPALVIGSLQSALFMAAAISLFYGWLRTLPVSVPSALIFSALLAFNAVTLDNGTCVELYAITMFFVVLSLRALGREFREATRLSARLFALSHLAILLFHVGYGMWTLASYLTVMWRDRKDFEKTNRWVGYGLLSILVLLAVGTAQGHLTPDEERITRWFFNTFWGMDTYGHHLWPLLQSPVFLFTMYSGLLVFPALLGAAAFGREFPYYRQLLVLATICFLPIYSYWMPGRGEFLMPLQPIYAMFSALAYDRLFRSAPRRQWLLFLLATCAVFMVFIFLPYGTIGTESRPLTPRRSYLILADIPGIPSIRLGLIVGAFYLAAGIQLIAARRIPTSSGGKSSGVRDIAFATCTLLLSFSVYLPEFREMARPDNDSHLLKAFVAGTSPESRLITRIDPFRSSAQSERQTLSPLSGEKALIQRRKNADGMNAWVQLMEKRTSPPIYLDEMSYRDREYAWTALGFCRRPVGDFSFKRTPMDGFTFYRLELKP